MCFCMTTHCSFFLLKKAGIFPKWIFFHSLNSGTSKQKENTMQKKILQCVKNQNKVAALFIFCHAISGAL